MLYRMIAFIFTFQKLNGQCISVSISAFLHKGIPFHKLRAVKSPNVFDVLRLGLATSSGHCNHTILDKV